MGALEIFVIVAGLAVIIASFFISERSGSDTYNIDMESVDLILESRRQKMTEEIDSLFKQYEEEAVLQARDQMGQLCNEKIMAVNEFSDQILDKLEQNHKEVVFLYDMLTEKETEIKKLIQIIDRTKWDQEIKIEQAEQMEQTEQTAESTMVTAPIKKDGSAPSKRKGKSSRQNRNRNLGKKDSATYQDTQAAAVLRESRKNEAQEKENTGENNNNEILKLYAEGKTVMEISKLLGQGQGEVKLVIDLFQGVK